MENNTGVRSLLTRSIFYDAIQWAIGGYAFKRRFIETHIQSADASVLDLGCGTGRTASWLPTARYLGVDLSGAYIEAARQRDLPQAEFVVGDCVAVSATLPANSYDWILTNGLMHHLDRMQCERMLAESARLLRPGGELIGFEPVWLEDQSWSERFVMQRDRGSHVLTLESWRQLLRSAFDDVGVNVARKELNVPYALVLFRCRVSGSARNGA